MVSYCLALDHCNLTIFFHFFFFTYNEIGTAGQQNSNTKKYNNTEKGGNFPNLLLPRQCSTRNPIEVTIPGKSRKKIVKAPGALDIWSFSNNTLAFQMVEILLKSPKMMPPTMSSIFLNVVNAILSSEIHFQSLVHFCSFCLHWRKQLTKGECDSQG